MTELKRCPFCGVAPRLYWESWSEISENAGTYVLEADHRNCCFIVSMNGFNITGKMTSFNKDFLIEAWNGRVEE